MDSSDKLSFHSCTDSEFCNQQQCLLKDALITVSLKYAHRSPSTGGFCSIKRGSTPSSRLCEGCILIDFNNSRLNVYVVFISYFANLDCVVERCRMAVKIFFAKIAQ